MLTKPIEKQHLKCLQLRVMSSSDVTRLVAQLFVRSQAPGADVGGACARHLGEGLPEARSLLDELGEVRTKAMALTAGGVGEQAATQAAGQTDAALVKRAVLDTMRRNVVALAGLLSAALASGAVTAEQVSGLSMEVLRVPWPGAADAGAADAGAVDAGAAGTGAVGGSASSEQAVKAVKAAKAGGVLPKFGGSYKQHSGDASHADCDHDHGPDKLSKAQLSAAKHARTAAAKHARNTAKKAAATAAKGGDTSGGRDGGGGGGRGGGDGVLASALVSGSGPRLWEGRDEGGEKGERRSNNVAKHVKKHVKKYVKVAVVGAGPHGLSVVAKLLETRVDPQEETPDNEVIFAKGRNGTTIRARHEHDPSAGVGTSKNHV